MQMATDGEEKGVTHLEGSGQVGTRLLLLWVWFLLFSLLGLFGVPSRILVFVGCGADPWN